MIHRKSKRPHLTGPSPECMAAWHKLMERIHAAEGLVYNKATPAR